jgi:hypothetical protein
VKLRLTVSSKRTASAVEEHTEIVQEPEGGESDSSGVIVSCYTQYAASSIDDGSLASRNHWQAIVKDLYHLMNREVSRAPKGRRKGEVPVVGRNLPNPKSD